LTNIRVGVFDWGFLIPPVGGQVLIGMLRKVTQRRVQRGL